MKKTKTEKGITLIALIITIVILLILAVVAIRAIQGDGILGHARNARDEQIDAETKEKMELAAYEYKIEMSKGNVMGTQDKYILEHEYNVQLGDIVNYEEPSNLNYNGTWRVLGINDNGQVTLVSSGIVGEIELAGKDGYNNGPQKLNEICDDYANGTTGVSARSIKAEDLNELVGYNPEKELTGKNYQAGNANEYGVVATYKKIKEESDKNTFEYTRKKMDGTIETTQIEFAKSDSRTGEFLDINSENAVGNEEYLGLNESITMNFFNNYYVYYITPNIKEDTTTNAYPTYYSTMYTLDDTLAGNVSRAGYKDLFFAKDESGNYIGTYWLANKSELAHNGGAGWGIRIFNRSGTGGLMDRVTLFHAGGKGDTANGLNTGEYSSTAGVRVVVNLNSKAYFEAKGDGTYNVHVGDNPNKFMTSNKVAQDENGNSYVVPKGFRVVPNLTNKVTEGIVIEDEIGNQFVWVPVGNINTDSGTVTISLKRYQFDTSGKASTYTGNFVENTLETNPFVSSVEKYGGYYVARCEARISTNNKVSTNPNHYVKTKLYREEALSLSKSMYNENSSFVTSLMNSYAWDTAIVFIQTFENDRATPYSLQYSLNNKTNGKGFAEKGTNMLEETYKDKACNIYDMASNCWEWTTESDAKGVSVFRGSNYAATNLNTSIVSARTAINVAYSMNTFRPVLYLK